LGTFSAAGLALAMAELSKLAEDWQRLMIIVNIFTVGMVSCFVCENMLYPKMYISDIFISGFLCD